MTAFSHPSIRPNRLRPLAAAILTLALPGLASQAAAQSSQSEIAELRAQIVALSSRLEELESKNSQVEEKVAETVKKADASAWVSNIRISGDLRTRYERHEDSSKPSARNRDRIRGRLDISADVKDDWGVSFGLATGDGDPISTNQSFGEGGSTKDMRLDYAYFTYEGFDNMLLTGGKYKNVFFKPGGSGQNLIFDGDYRPEGLGFKYSANGLFFNAATMELEGDNKFGSQDAEMMWGLQTGYKTSLTDDASVTFGLSYYEAAVSGSKPFFENNPYRNTLKADGTYMYDYEDIEVFAQVDTRLGSQPLRLFGDYVENQGADAYDTAWALGAKLGSVSGKGTWELSWIYQDLGADAIYSALTDSDFGGGGSDSKGHILDAAYGIADNTEVGITYFINKYGEASKGQWIDFDRLHIWVTVDF